MKLEVEAKLKLACVSQQIFGFVRLCNFHSTEADRRKMVPEVKCLVLRMSPENNRDFL